MSHIPAAQRYTKAAAQASRDRNRPRNATPIVALGEVTLKELRGLMGVSLQQFSDLLEEATNHRWTRVQLSRVENAVRPMTQEMQRAVNQLVELRKKGS